mgnify:CR=1 FL=1
MKHDPKDTYARAAVHAFILIVIVLAFVWLAGCVALPRAPHPELNAPPKEEVLETADYGVPPEADHQDEIRDAFARLLLDPYSARFTFAAPERGWAHQYVLGGTTGGPYSPGHDFGWVVAFDVNARNAFGGYTGTQRTYAFFRDGKLRAILRNEGLDIFGYVWWYAVALM